jgi:hypothetical protein
MEGAIRADKRTSRFQGDVRLPHDDHLPVLVTNPYFLGAALHKTDNTAFCRLNARRFISLKKEIMKTHERMMLKNASLRAGMPAILKKNCFFRKKVETGKEGIC